MTAPQDPVPHDPWLREALRHAPDAEAGPPARLDDHILQMGRAAVAPRPAPAPPRAPTLGERLLAAWDWLARPPVAAGFASVLVASVVGVMWWGRPLQDAPPPADTPATMARAPDAARPEPPAAAPAPATPPPPARAPLAEPARPATRPDVAQRKAAPEPAPAAAPAPIEKSAEKPTERAAESAAAKVEAAPPLRGLTEQREMAAADAAAPAAPAALGALRARAASGTIETPGLSNLRFEIPRRRQDWTWQRNDGPARPVDDAMTDWLALADRTSRPHWNPGSAAGEGAVATLRFTRDGSVRAILRVGPKGLRLERGGKSESAELSGAQAATLLGALDALGP